MLPRLRPLAGVLLGPLLGWLALPAAGGPDSATLFPLGRVQLLDGPFAHAQELNREYVLAHDPDRLLAPFRQAAGLPPKAENYPNWESQGLAGHSAGHYLTALAQLIATTADPEAQRRLDYMIAELAACQEAHGDGYVGAIGESDRLWSEVAAGDLRVEPFSVNGAWVPWYNLHKTFQGLRDAWQIAGHEQAREVLVRLSDWCAALVANLSEAQMQDMLRAEHGGMNEILADVARITGDKRYLALAERFSHHVILEPLARGEDRLDGLHANTQIPKVIGFARIAELGGDPAGTDAARFFWDTVVGRRSVAFGGNSVREHFNSPDNFLAVLESREGPETCNTYNMLRLTEQLFRAHPSRHYADYYERALFNHILSSQHPDHGGLVYFTPIRPRHYRVYSQPEVCFWCCVGSGMESHGKYGQFIYAEAPEGLIVNLFIASQLDWSERGVTVRQETRFPDEPRSVLTLGLTQPRRFSVYVRHPEWLSPGELGVTINGSRVTAPTAPSGYVELTREWREGDRIELTLPMRTTLEPLPGENDYVALLHGPIVLAAKTSTADLEGLVADDSRFGHIAPGPYRPLAEAPMLVGERDELVAAVQREPGAQLRFTAAAAIEPASADTLELIPFFRVHDARYMMYWRAVTPEQRAEVVAELAQAEAAEIALRARTVDQVSPGEQQPEVEHDYAGEDSRTGTHLGRHWRDTGRQFSYRLNPRGRADLELRVTTFGGERDRGFEIVANGQLIGAVTLDGSAAERFVDHTFPLPAGLAGDEPLTVTFRPKGGPRTGAIYDVRLLAR